MLGSGIEAFDKLTKDQSILDKIWNKLSKIKYGTYNTKTKKYTNNINEDNYKYMKILTPEETMKNRYGTCFEQSILTAYLAKQNNLQYSCGMYVNKIGNTHLICCVKYENAWYWIEHSWNTYKKIHGPFLSLKDIDKTVSKLMLDFHKSPITYRKFDFKVEQFFSGTHIYPEITEDINEIPY